MSEATLAHRAGRTLSDDIGMETLARMARMARYNRWLAAQFVAHLGQQTLEVGCGIGNITQHLLGRTRVVAIDPHPAAVAMTRQRFAGQPGLVVQVGDILDRHCVARLRRHHFDGAVCCNVLEHIADAERALAHLHWLLPPGGTLALVVPAGPALYGSLDRALAHQCRYTRAGLRSLVTAQGFAVQTLGAVNLAGVVGWFLCGRVLGARVLPRPALRAFNALAPVLLPLESALRRRVDLPWGQSLVCIARRAE